MSDKPEKKPGRLAEIRQAYTALKTLDPKLGWWMLGAAVVTGVLVMGIGSLFADGWWLLYPLLLAIPAAALAAVIVMNRRGNKAMYGALDGKVGATGAALTGLGRRGWYAAQEPVAIEGARGTRAQDLANAAMVFRAVGRPGIVLLGEGQPGRVARMLKAEEKRVARVAPGVPVHLWTVGDGEDQVPVRKIAGKLTRMKPVLSKQEVSVVNKRLTSLGGLRPPVPKGVDPTKARMDRKALRGR